MDYRKGQIDTWEPTTAKILRAREKISLHSNQGFTDPGNSLTLYNRKIKFDLFSFVLYCQLVEYTLWITN